MSDVPQFKIMQTTPCILKPSRFVVTGRHAREWEGTKFYNIITDLADPSLTPTGMFVEYQYLCPNGSYSIPHWAYVNAKISMIFGLNRNFGVEAIITNALWYKANHGQIPPLQYIRDLIGMTK